MKYSVSVWTLAFGDKGLNDELFIHYPEFSLLKSILNKNDIEIHTFDVLPVKDADINLYCNILEVNEDGAIPKKSIAINYECEVIHPYSWSSEAVNKMSTVLSYATDANFPIVDCRVWPQFYEQFPLERFVEKKFSQKTKLCVLIAGLKYVNHPLELYSKRIDAIRWFEKNHREEFTLYGRGWERGEYKKPSIYRRIRRKLGLHFEETFIPFPSYQGEIPGPPGSAEKIEAMSEFKFSICYENATIAGYVTEKIFDFLFASCIPVYWGAKDIENFVDADCFINFKDFNYDLRKLHQFITNMQETEYDKYIANIKRYLQSDKFKMFSYERYAETISREIINKLGNQNG